MQPAYKIEKGVPIPERFHGNGPKPNYPFNQLEIGESFLMPKTLKHPDVSVRVARQRYAPKEFTYRKTEDGLRVWRTK